MPYADPAMRREHYRAKYADDTEWRERTTTYRNEWRRANRANNPALRHRESVKSVAFFRRLRDIAAAIKLERGCIDCGYNAHAEALDFDHVNDDKLCNVSQCHNERQLLAEIAKCEVVCANCHRVRTAARR